MSAVGTILGVLAAIAIVSLAFFFIWTRLFNKELALWWSQQDGESSKAASAGGGEG